MLGPIINRSSLASQEGPTTAPSPHDRIAGLCPRSLGTLSTALYHSRDRGPKRQAAHLHRHALGPRSPSASQDHPGHRSTASLPRSARKLKPPILGNSAHADQGYRGPSIRQKNTTPVAHHARPRIAAANPRATASRSSRPAASNRDQIVSSSSASMGTESFPMLPPALPRNAISAESPAFPRGASTPLGCTHFGRMCTQVQPCCS